MNITIYPKKLHGSVCAIPSKSQAHRLLILSAFADKPTTLQISSVSADIAATVDCLSALGAMIRKTPDGYCITPSSTIPHQAVLNCRESGSTLRFMLPIAAALGVNAHFRMSGRLAKRPLSPLWEELERMGCQLRWENDNTLQCTGQLRSGAYTIAGNVSSQFISGLMFALALLPGVNTLSITGNMESAPYIELTKQAFSCFGVPCDTLSFNNTRFHSPGNIRVEGDWSNAAFFLTAAALGNDVAVAGLQMYSPQGDRAVMQILEQLSENTQLDCSDVPDLVPILSVAAAAKNGAVFQNIERLRWKESDRVEAICEMLSDFMIPVEATGNLIRVSPAPFHGCTVDAKNDHRIAMAAAIAATIADAPVTIKGAECVQKSYPEFWDVYKALGGQYEQHLR